MVELINCIIKKWTKISARESNSFCPYIFIYNYTLEQLVELKKELRNNKITFWDGFNYEGAEFSVQEICKQANHNNGIQIKFINRIEFVENIIQETKKTKEIYQFYYNEPFFINENSNIKHIKVQILNINEIKEII